MTVYIVTRNGVVVGVYSTRVDALKKAFSSIVHVSDAVQCSAWAVDGEWQGAIKPTSEEMKLWTP